MYRYANMTDMAEVRHVLSTLNVKADEVDKLLAQANRVEVWASSFNDPGPDYSEVRILDAAGALLQTKRIEGY